MGDKYTAVFDQELLVEHYAQPHVIESMLKLSQDREVVGSFGGKGYASRPALLLYKNDIINQVKMGVTSFHFSEERWSNPLVLAPGMNEADQDRFRKGWDLVIDIDCSELEYSKIAGQLIVEALEFYEIKGVSAKFSGNHGFHIGVPFESFPEIFNGQPMAHRFPEAPRKIALFLKEMIREQLEHQLLAQDDIPTMEKKIGKTLDPFDPFEVLEIDTILLASRHLVRHVYSANEKSGLVSIPINPKKIRDFDKDIAKVENKVKSRFSFLDPHQAIPGEMLNMLEQAYAQQPVVKERKVTRTYQHITDQVPEDFFPPSMKQMLNGVADGRKRALFVLTSFLRSLGWSIPQIEQRLEIWNAANTEPLKKVHLAAHIRSVENKEAQLPPNFDSQGYYADIGIDTSLEISRGYKNPVTFALRGYRRYVQDNDKNNARELLTEEQKALRRQHREKLKKQQEDVDDIII